MEQPVIEQQVRLVRDIPELGLCRGEVGVVCSTWSSPTPAYEVEFETPGRGHKTRTLLLGEQVQPYIAEAA